MHLSVRPSAGPDTTDENHPEIDDHYSFNSESYELQHCDFLKLFCSFYQNVIIAVDVMQYSLMCAKKTDNIYPENKKYIEKLKTNTFEQ